MTPDSARRAHVRHAAARLGDRVRERVRERASRSAGTPGNPEYEGGRGSPLLLVHGVGATWRVWLPVLPALIRHHHVLAPTLMGHDGALPLPVGTAPSVRALVDAVEADLDRHGLDRVHVAGNSLGGWIALELARRDRARSVVAFSPAGAWRSSARMAALAAGMRTSFLVASVLAGRPGRPEALAASPRARQLLLGTQVAHPEHLDDAEVAEALRAIRRSPVVRPLIKTIRDAPLSELPHDPSVPVRVVWPWRDRVIPFADYGSAMMSRLPGAELVRMDGIGHVPMSDDPAGVAERILEVTAREEPPRTSTIETRGKREGEASA